MNPVLDSCPHCGSAAELRDMLQMTWWVQCTNNQCGAQTRHCGTADGAELAVQLWNARYLQPDEAATYAIGEWDMFRLITSTWYGKQCYFREDNGIVYSRLSNKYLTVDQAYTEFLGQIGDNGDY